MVFEASEFVWTKQISFARHYDTLDVFKVFTLRTFYHDFLFPYPVIRFSCKVII